MTKRQAVKRVEKAIDQLEELKDAGWGSDPVTQALEILNSLCNDIESGRRTEY